MHAVQASRYKRSRPGCYRVDHKNTLCIAPDVIDTLNGAKQGMCTSMYNARVRQRALPVAQDDRFSGMADAVQQNHGLTQRAFDMQQSTPHDERLTCTGWPHALLQQQRLLPLGQSSKSA